MDPKVATAIRTEVRRQADQTTEFLRETIRVPSVTGVEGNVISVYEKAFRELGLETERQVVDRDEVGEAYPFWEQETDLPARPNLIARWTVGRSPALAINGHFDVVPAGESSNWSEPPFGAVVRDGYVVGRGAVDMKGGLAAGIAALRAIRALGLEPSSDLVFQHVMGEETGGLGTIAAVIQGDPIGAGIVLEPTDLTLARAQSGLLKFTLEVSGRTVHTSAPWSGVSAYEQLGIVYGELLALSEERNRSHPDPLFDDLPNKVPFAVGIVQAGHHAWTLPNHAEASGRFGVLVGETLDAAREAFELRLAAVAERHSWMRDHPPVVKWAHGAFPGWATASDAGVVAALRAALVAARGQSIETGVSYGCDASHLHRLTGIPLAIFGPGSITSAHIPDEAIAIDDVLSAAEVLALTVLAWNGEGNANP